LFRINELNYEKSLFEEALLIYGNHHRLIPEETTNQHEWRLFVDISSDSL